MNAAPPAITSPTNNLSRATELRELPFVGDPVLEAWRPSAWDLVDLHLADEAFGDHDIMPLTVKNVPM